MYPGVLLKCFSGGPTRHNATAADATTATTSAAAVAAAADTAAAAAVTSAAAAAAQPSYCTTQFPNKLYIDYLTN